MEPWLVGAIIGAVFGLSMLLIMAMGKSTRDQVIFRSPADVYGVLRGWASEYGFAPTTPTGPGVTLRRGKGFWTAPIFVAVENRGDEYKLESWIQVNAFVKKRDMALAAPGFAAKLPRSNGLAAVNDLLANLGQPPIRKR